ncbi:hypothetical protein [Flavitalea sp.]|nr:hypothetical protein [Flavitalea sp.]
MQRCFNVPFDFKGKEYYAIVRQQTINNKKNYKIRVMNHRLDALLHKSNLTIIEECDGNVSLPPGSNLTEEGELHLSIARALSIQLSHHCNADFDFIPGFKLLTPL